jgi:hypothetical protein
MVEVEVKRTGPSVWPWIAGLFVVALLIWALLELFGRNAPEVLEDEPIATVTGQGRPGAALFAVPRLSIAPEHGPSARDRTR